MTKLPIPQQLQAFARTLRGAGEAIYCVGGCVRDWLLNREVSDIDLCSALTPQQMLALCAERDVCCTIKCERTGTVLIKLGDSSYEHTTFRTESYGAGGKHRPDEVRFTASLKQDAFRRDFSVNAIYYNLLTEELIDPTGGLNDINNKVLRTTTAEPSEILKDDGLRILRLVRFAFSLGFSVDKATKAAAKEYGWLLNDVSFERKRDELNRILVLERVYDALCMMDELDIFKYVIPEMDACRDMEQRKDHHKHDVLHHIFHATENIPPEVDLRYMALLHDIGKPPCKKDTGKQILHDVYSARMAEEILNTLMLPKLEIERITAAIKNHMFDIRDEAREDTVRRHFCRLGIARIRDLIALREADVRGCGYDLDYVAVRWRRILDEMIAEGVPFSVSELNVSGEDIMQATGLPPSKRVGELQQFLLMHCSVSPRDNSPEKLKKLLRDYEKPQ